MASGSSVQEEISPFKRPRLSYNPFKPQKEETPGATEADISFKIRNSTGHRPRDDIKLAGERIHHWLEGELPADDNMPSSIPSVIINDNASSSGRASPYQDTEQAADQSSLADWSTTDSLAVNYDEGSTANNDDDDNLSEASNLSGFSGQDWKFSAGPMGWVQKQMLNGLDPRILLRDLLPQGVSLPPDIDDLTLWRIVVNILSEPPKRTKLDHVNTLDDVVQLIKSSRSIIVLTGAGVSVSCGIPDFRSRDGIYARLSHDFPDLPDPQAMFDIHYFRRDPRPFFKFAKEIYPGQFQPSPSHNFIRLIERNGQLLRNYTQNIDTLEQIAGISKVIQCHGSFATATCMNCRRKVDANEIKQDIFNQTIPRCDDCAPETPHAIMKPDIVFFGEGLSEEFHRTMADDKNECDLLIVIGSSLKVRPVALIPSSIPPEIPQVLINREPLPHMNFDVELLGDCDVIVKELCRLLGDSWTDICGEDAPVLTQITELPQMDSEKSVERKLKMISEIDDPAARSVPEKMETSDSYTKEVVDKKTTDTAATRGASLVQNRNSELAIIDESSSMSIVSQKTDLTSLSSENYESERGDRGTESCNDMSLDASEATPVVRDSPANPFFASRDAVARTTSTSSKHDEHEFEEIIQAQADVEELRRCYEPRRTPKVSLAKQLPANSFLFVFPNRYVFHGAEVTAAHSTCSSTDDDEDVDTSGSISDSETENTGISEQQNSLSPAVLADTDSSTTPVAVSDSGVLMPVDDPDYIGFENVDACVNSAE